MVIGYRYRTRDEETQMGTTRIHSREYRNTVNREEKENKGNEQIGEKEWREIQQHENVQSNQAYWFTVYSWQSIRSPDASFHHPILFVRFTHALATPYTNSPRNHKSTILPRYASNTRHIFTDDCVSVCRFSVFVFHCLWLFRFEFYTDS